MGKLKRLSLLIVLLAGTSLCFANQISFQIVQHDDSLDSVSEDSMVIEDSVLNNFFEYGFIVTNSDAAISESLAQDERLYKIGQGDAFNGFSDYFVQIKLYYERTDQTLSTASDLYKINFSITSIKTGKKIAEELSSYITQNGGVIKLNTVVGKVLVENGRAEHILCRIPLIPDHNNMQFQEKSKNELIQMGIGRFDLFTYTINQKNNNENKVMSVWEKFRSCMTPGIIADLELEEEE